MGTLNTPGDHDCLKGLDPNEPYFLIKARDPAFYGAIDAWVKNRMRSIDMGILPDNEEERAKIAEAKKLRSQAVAWMYEHRPDRARAIMGGDAPA